MKSTSGGVIMWSGQCIKAWSTSQSALALSSGEAELFAMAKVAVQLSGVISMAKNFGVSLTGVVKSDSSSAIGIAHRDGLGGRCRHIKVQYLWIQSKIKDGDLKLQKVLGTNNVADAMTKAVDRWALDKYMAAMNFIFDARSRGQSISRSAVWHIFMNGLAFISTEGGVKILPMRQLTVEAPYLQKQ